jgi:VCBS repeat-containing protein
MKTAIEKRLEELYQPKSDYAFLMGGGQVLKDMISGQVGPIGPFIPEGMQQMIGELIDFVAELHTIKHNRMYIPTDKPYLSFEVFTPFMITDDARLTIAFEGAGEALGINPTPETKELLPGFLEKRIYTVTVPEALKGKMATVSFTHSRSLEGRTGVPYTFQEYLAGVGENLTSTISQLFFLDDIRFVDSVITVSTTPINENQAATITIDFTPVDAARETNLTINWGDGTTTTRVAAAGVTSLTATHLYQDDNPTQTTFDEYRVDVSTDNTATTGTGIQRVNNVAPLLSPITLSTLEINEGQEVRVEGTYTDVGPLDTFKVEIDWGDGSERTIVEQPALNGATGSFSAMHKYEDDNPETRTPFDMLPIRVTVIDDDFGASFTERKDIKVNNIAPRLDQVRLSDLDIKEGETITLTGNIIDPGVKDTFTLTIDWGDGSDPEVKTFGPYLTGNGSFSIEHTYEDDDPETGTKFDRLTVKVKLEDDDTGMDETERDLTVRNVAPVIDTLTITPDVVDEGAITTLRGTFTDPGKDSFKLEINWGDGGDVQVVDIAEGETAFEVEHIYKDDEAPGDDDIFTVAVKLIDDDTGEDTGEVQVSVKNVAPTLSNVAFADTSIFENGIARLQFDLDDPGEGDTFTITIDWKDGSEPEVLAGLTMDTLPLFIEHRYLDDDPSGTIQDLKNVTIKVKDDDGDSGDGNAGVTVRNRPPRNVDAGVPIVAGSGVPFTLSGTFIDDGTQDTHEQQWTISGPGGTDGGMGASFTTSFDIPGTYIATYTVTDDDNGSAFATTSVVVTAAPPSIDPIALPDLDEGDIYTLEINVNGVSAGGVYEIEVDWGDGTIDTGIAVPAPGAPGGVIVVPVMHHYKDDEPGAADDIYHVKARLLFPNPGGQPFQVGLVREDTVKVSNVAPAPTLEVTGNATTGLTFTLSINDPGILDTHNIVWNFGDGSAPVNGGLTQTRAFSSPATVTATVTDDDGGIGVASRIVSIPLLAGGTGAASAAAVIDAGLIAQAIAAAQGYWSAIGADTSALAAVAVEVLDLEANMLGSTFIDADGGAHIRLDHDAAGFGWFVDATPSESSEYTLVNGVGERFASVGDAAGRMDLLTALVHEYGHVLGLGHGAQSSSGSVMLEALSTGVRRLPQTTDLALVGEVPGGHDLHAAGIHNGNFNIANVGDSGFGWTLLGGAEVTGGQGVLTEEDTFLAGISQAFLLPAGAQRLVFTLVLTDLQANASGPVDAFEVALRTPDPADPTRMIPLAGVAPIANTDSLLNIQTGGATFASDRVTIAGLTDRNGGLLDLTNTIQVAIDLTGIAAGTQALLSFDLIGFDERESRVVIDDVRIETDGVVNAEPVAVGDTLSVAEDRELIISAADLLGNDEDADGDPLTLVAGSIVTGATAHGILVANADGTYTYKPNANYFGADTFTYRATDGEADSNVATVTINVTPVNDAPVAQGIVVSTKEDEAAAAIDLLGAVSDIDTATQNIAVSIVSTPTRGTLVANPNGTYTYTPDANYFGPDSFTYKASDGEADSNVATVTITVTPVNDAPVFVSTPVTTINADAVPAAPQDRVFRTLSGGGSSSTTEASFTLSAKDATKYEFGVVRVDDAQGRIGNLLPTDAGYVEAALSSRATVVFNARGVVNEQTKLDLSPNAYYGFYVIVSPKRPATPGGSPVGPAPYGSYVYFSFEGANPEGFDHLKAEVVDAPAGTNGTAAGAKVLKLSLETFVHLGDRDFNDLIITARGFELGGLANYGYRAQAQDVEGDTLSYSVIPPGNLPQGATVSIDPQSGALSVTSLPPGVYELLVKATETNTVERLEARQSFTLTVSPPSNDAPLTVEALVATPSGVRVRFNHGFDPSLINADVLGTTVSAGADLEITDSGGNRLSGAVVVDDDHAGFSFIKAGGHLSPGSYTVKLRSAQDAFERLDGNKDGTAGDDYVGQIQITPSTLLGRIGIEDIELAPGERKEDIELTLTSAGQVNAARFNLIYDPALFTPESATLAQGLPQGTFLSTDFRIPGYAKFTLSAPKALPQGSIPLILLKGSVPTTAPQGAKHILDIVEVFVNGSLAGDSDDGIHALGDPPAPVQVLSLDGPEAMVLFATGPGLTGSVQPTGGQTEVVQALGDAGAGSARTNSAPASGNDPGTPQSTPEPQQTSKLTKVLSRIKEAVVGALLAKHQATPIEVSQAPALPLIESAKDRVRTLSSTHSAEPLSIDLTGSTGSTMRIGALSGSNGAHTAGAATTSPMPKWHSAFVTTLGATPTVNPNAAIKVTVK